VRAPPRGNGPRQLSWPYLPTILVATAIDRAAPTRRSSAGFLPSARRRSRDPAFLDGELSWAPDAIVTRAEKSEAAGRSRREAVRGVGAPRGRDARARAHGRGADVVPRGPRAGGIKQTPVTGMDLATRWVNLTLDRVAVTGDAVLGAEGLGQPLLDALLRMAPSAPPRDARRGAPLPRHGGGIREVREQFGQPIGSFQAIRHKCAEMLLEVENSHAAVYYAAWALDADAEDASSRPR